MRKAFGLLTAIMFIVLVATIGALALSFSTQTNKQTSDAYLKAQAELLSYSATEYALLALSGHKISSNCIEKISANYNDFKIYVTFKYIGNNLPCTTLAGANAIATPYSNVTVLMDTIIEFNATIGNEPIRIHRRTLQKP
jgi:cytochrome bd-type quinol oxidase subunit 2